VLARRALHDRRQKLSQDVPESNLVLEEKKGAPQHTAFVGDYKVREDLIFIVPEELQLMHSGINNTSCLREHARIEIQFNGWNVPA
jgi:hypothetical protein